jgi:anti-sigma factor RsiW
MNLSCAQVEERLSDYLDRALTSDEKAMFFAHLDGCPECSQLVLGVQELTIRMPRLAPVAEPPALEVKILDSTLGERREGWRGWFGWINAIWQPQFAIGIATAAVSLMIAFHALAPRAEGMTAADLTPASVARAANRQAHLVYARGAKFVNDLRLVYEIQSRFSAPEAASSGDSNREQQAPFDGQPKTNFVPPDTGGARVTLAETLNTALSKADRSYR